MALIRQEFARFSTLYLISPCTVPLLNSGLSILSVPESYYSSLVCSPILYNGSPSMALCLLRWDVVRPYRSSSLLQGHHLWRHCISGANVTNSISDHAKSLLATLWEWPSCLKVFSFSRSSQTHRYADVANKVAPLINQGCHFSQNQSMTRPSVSSSA